MMKREMTVKNQKPERRRANSGQCNPANPIPDRNERTRKGNGSHQSMRVEKKNVFVAEQDPGRSSNGGKCPDTQEDAIERPI
jgi:hypothetical protein